MLTKREDTNDDQNRIEAMPTKEFFIKMLVKDIELIPAIVDMVDNCVDGAIRIRNEERFERLWIKINFDKRQFSIVDNCGGIPLDLAKEYAFRFGRPDKSANSIPHSIGQFGVGMKRALFKIGKVFEIESTSKRSHFKLKVDVEKWRKETGPWKFEFIEADEYKKDLPETEWNTTIQVSSLHNSIAETFALENFKSNLIREIHHRHMDGLNKGLMISVNNEFVKPNVIELCDSKKIKTGFKERKFDGNNESPVLVKIFVGISKPKRLPSEAGWNFYCNGRQILRSDQTTVTGWGDNLMKELKIPRYHGQFSMFRGYVFVDSNDSSRLPWNTTKTGIDTESPIYSCIKEDMLQMMRPVIDFLNQYDKERDLNLQSLTDAVKEADLLKLEMIKDMKGFFDCPDITTNEAIPKKVNISYQVPEDKLNKAKKALKVTSAKAVGERSFKYYFDAECNE